MKNKLFLRLLLALCVCALMISFAGCTEKEPQETPKVQLLDSHEVIITDIGTGRIVVTDLDKEDPFAEENLIWEWIPSAEQGWDYITQASLVDSLSGLKYRWSEHFKTNVVLFTSARGAAGMIEYPSGKCLWKAKVGQSPHSIEMMPNGDIVVASSGGGDWEEGRLFYYDLKNDGTYEATTEHYLNGAHGVLWDTDNNVLWALGFPELVAYMPGETSGGQATLYLVDGWGAKVPDGSGHDLMPDFGNRDIMWITDNVSIYQFSKYQNKVLKEFPNAKKMMQMPAVKGVTSFTDGVVAFVSYGDKDGADHPATVRAFWPKEDGTFELVKYVDDGSGWNKIRVFTTDYL